MYADDALHFDPEWTAILHKTHAELRQTRFLYRSDPVRVTDEVRSLTRAYIYFLSVPFFLQSILIGFYDFILISPLRMFMWMFMWMFMFMQEIEHVRRLLIAEYGSDLVIPMPVDPAFYGRFSTAADYCATCDPASSTDTAAGSQMSVNSPSTDSTS